MAMSVPKMGFSRMMKEGARRFKGNEESVQRNIEACVELAAQIRSAYGPNGMNKMVINHIQKLFVTKDANTILNELEVQHPAAKMMILAAKMQSQEIGDGTNTVIILCASLLEHASELVKMGLKPVEIAEGYELAADKALEILPKLSCASVDDIRNVEKVKKAVRGAVMSKQYGQEDFIANLVAQACVQVTPKNDKNFNVDNIRTTKILGSGVMNSKIMNGMVFKRGVEGPIKKVSKAKIAVFTCPFDITQTETTGTVLIENADELMNFSKGEESSVEAQVKALADEKYNVVAAGGKFGELYLHFMNKYGIMGVRVMSKFDLRRLCKTTGAQAQTTIRLPPPGGEGNCDEVYVEELGDTEVVVFEQKSEHGKISTIVIRGSSDNLMDDIERAVNAGVNTFKAVTKDDRLVGGAGAVEIELARQIESFGEKCPGLEQYAIQKFALSLEALPKQLADNSGVKSTEILSKLYAEHQEGKATAGFDIEAVGGGVVDVTSIGIYDLYNLKESAIRLATNAAATILKIDEIIMAKQASGPKPRDARPQDEDDQ